MTWICVTSGSRIYGRGLGSFIFSPRVRRIERNRNHAVLTRLRDFLSDIRRIREALERIPPPYPPPDPRKQPKPGWYDK